MEEEEDGNEPVYFEEALDHQKVLFSLWGLVHFNFVVLFEEAHDKKKVIFSFPF